MAWQKNGTPVTLVGTGDTITITDLTPLKFNVMLSHNLVTGAGNQTGVQMGNGSIDVTTNYNARTSTDGGTDATVQFSSALIGVNATADSTFDMIYEINIPTEEKLGIAFEVHNPVLGAGTAPRRAESVFKWANTSVQFDQFQTKQESGTGDYVVNSNLSALGTD